MVVHLRPWAVLLPKVLVELAPHRSLASAGLGVEVVLLLLLVAADVLHRHGVGAELPLEIVVGVRVRLPLLVGLVQPLSIRQLRVLLSLEDDDFRVGRVL